MMRWKIVLAVLASLTALDFGLPPEDSGPGNVGRLFLGIYLAMFLVMTFIAWLTRGRVRAVVLLLMATPVWLCFGLVFLDEALRWPSRSKIDLEFTIGFEVTLGLIAVVITAVAVFYWRKRPGASSNRLRRDDLMPLAREPNTVKVGSNAQES